MKIFAKLLYWKLCFPSFIELIPPRLRIVSGPFRGMRYNLVACGSAHSAKLLGTYEKELHAIIDEILAERFEEIIDIGAAEGYYAVGLALSSPSPRRVIAFEAQEQGRQLLQELAAGNSLKNVDIRGACDVMGLEQALAGGRPKLIICDVEGV
jgi:tRNA G46 methylase TrmB